MKNPFRSEPANVGMANGKLKQHQEHHQNGWQTPTSPPGAKLPPKVPPKRNPSLNAAGFSPSPENGQQQRQSPIEPTADDSPVKVCLRDKKRQREQRIQMGVSVAASMSNGIGRVEASKADKQRWRCSSTMLLDDLYKDLSKSIPTIDDVKIKRIYSVIISFLVVRNPSKIEQHWWRWWWQSWSRKPFFHSFRWSAMLIFFHLRGPFKNWCKKAILFCEACC